jgi:release factor glutamine methyltransferase
MTSKPPSSAEPFRRDDISPEKPLSIGEWLRFVRQSQQSAKAATGVVDEQANQELFLSAQVLLAFIFGQTRAWVLAHPEAILDQGQLFHLNSLFQQLCQGVPLPYLTGKQEFFGLDFEVTRDVLIPRPETELLVEHALEWLRGHRHSRLAADVGTGSGCIAVSLAARLTYPYWLAVDRSWRALQVAHRNASRHAVTSRVQLLNADLLMPCIGPFDLVCANLPYIPHESLRFLPLLTNEPSLALDGGEDGLELIRRLFAGVQSWLAPGGVIFLEMQFDQGDKIARIAKYNLPAAQVTIHSDLAGKPRMVKIQNGKDG